MHIERHLDVIHACRFCFMCRHLDPVGNVSFRESDTPRGRALVLDRIRMEPGALANPDFLSALYRSALSGANRTHCVSHYDEIGLVLAARRDVVEAGLAPEPVKALAAELRAASFHVSGQADTLYWGERPALHPGCATVTGGDPGKALEVLGFAADAADVLARFRDAIAASRCATLVVQEPSSYDFLRDKLDPVAVVHSSEALLAREGPHAGARCQARYLPSDFLRNYAGDPPASRLLLERCGYDLLPIGTNAEESYAGGEGAVVYAALQPDLCERLCRRVAALAGDTGATPLVTASPRVRDTFGRYEPRVRILAVEDAVALRRERA